jgi:hypothetical protein
VPAEKLGEGVFVPSTDGYHEGGVAGIGQGTSHVLGSFGAGAPPG